LQLPANPPRTMLRPSTLGTLPQPPSTPVRADHCQQRQLFHTPPPALDGPASKKPRPSDSPHNSTPLAASSSSSHVLAPVHRQPPAPIAPRASAWSIRPPAIDADAPASPMPSGLGWGSSYDAFGRVKPEFESYDANLNLTQVVNNVCTPAKTPPSSQSSSQSQVPFFPAQGENKLPFSLPDPWG
jgi:hypothetical protein